MVNRIISVLDIGTTKIACFIGEQTNEGTLRILGMSVKQSHGIDSGRIANAKTVAQIIGRCVHAAEQMAQHPVDELILCLGGIAPLLKLKRNVIRLSHDPITKDTMERLNTRSVEAMSDYVLLHTIRGNTYLDGVTIEGSPEGLFGDELSVEYTQVYVQSAPLRNLLKSLSACQIRVRDIILSSYAAGLSTMIEEERKLGSLLIDFGGGLTQACIFQGHGIINAVTLGIGGNNITTDIAKGLSTPLSYAERLKTLFGSVLEQASSDMAMIETPYLGEDQHQDMNRIPKGFIASIITPRIEETLELLSKRFKPSDMARVQNIVVTGGASQLPGINYQVQAQFKKPVRLGRPRGFLGLADATGGPEFATVTGALRFYSSQVLQNRIIDPKPNKQKHLSLHGVFTWLKENI